MNSELLPCDGCGQAASPDHIARRLQRLEWTTRYRPVHIGTLLLGAVSPMSKSEFLYAGQFAGEAGRLLEAAGIERAGKSADVVLAEFQRGGYLLVYALECPLEPGGGPAETLLARRIPAVAARIRRSLRPKRVVIFGPELAVTAGMLAAEDLGCPVVLDNGKPFALGAGAFAKP